MFTEKDKLEIEVRQLREEKNKLLDLMARKEAEEKVNKKSANFVQVSRTVMREIRQLADNNKLALKILMLFGEKMNKQNAIVISQKTLCQLMGKGRTTVYNAVKYLEDEKWIKVLKIGTANAYIVNSQVFWTTGLQKQRYAIFSATVITAATEQDMPPESWDSIETKNFPFVNLKDDERTVLDNIELPPPDQTDLELN
ncbi:plasmid replication initiation protein [Salmonella enterica subsp. enterica serovar Muenchen]|uniref:Plasmid replication initiation protein n=1 Tax=Salmonella enterica I TaxID=59201 RepID=A0A3T7S7A4_SALET|nr:plasmid replication initiation protein [Salmonella enterica subsp. enterica serovar Java]EAA4514945.1 plasmid replication initiation protein [Salmonella enterica subsp. enterica serovar Vitkin]EBR9315469.1 plasmid replication initiation protein [Salmonella enterica subsp. enterica serovar Muenchen]EBT1575789.1 plasmid replication initiation protein [Salmonella enterica]EDQ3995774.1 plasmid replication initiation protein [Salmonella enterica subsp. enterica]EDU8208090.1 plasmid replication i